MNPNAQSPQAPELAGYQRTEGGYYPYQVTLTASQSLKDQSVPIDGDSDFLILALAGTQTGAYRLNFKTGTGRYLAQQGLRNANIVGTGQFPCVLPKPMLIPARGRIAVDIEDLSVAGNTVELVFIGIRLYRTGQPA